MRREAAFMHNDLDRSLSAGGSHGDFKNDRWSLTWRFGERRIEDKTRSNVLCMRAVMVFPKFRNRGFLTEVLANLNEVPQIGGRRIEWIYLDQVNHRFATHLEKALQYQSEFGMVIDCWRRVTGQLEMPL